MTKKKASKKVKAKPVKKSPQVDLNDLKSKIDDLHDVFIYNEKDLPPLLEDVRNFVKTTHELTRGIQEACMRVMIENMQQMLYMKKLTLTLIELGKKKGCEAEAIQKEAEDIFDQASGMVNVKPESRGKESRKEVLNSISGRVIDGSPEKPM